jgi:hypothetical protein
MSYGKKKKSLYDGMMNRMGRKTVKVNAYGKPKKSNRK